MRTCNFANSTNNWIHLSNSIYLEHPHALAAVRLPRSLTDRVRAGHHDFDEVEDGLVGEGLEAYRNRLDLGYEK